MKLKNKISGEIKEFVLFDGNELQGGATLESLTKDWEDVPEEPKEFWYIGQDGVIFSDIDTITQDYADRLESIGNYFETKEEAEQAVEKLKAWKRLKDKGFEWQGWEEGVMDNGMFVIGCQIPENNWETDVVDDLDTLFGGEE